MNDIYYIKRCLKLAKKGAGFVSPNPMVGAVLVKNNKIIGEGYHKKYGEAHAEINALRSATTDPEGATLYCNLEPCCHEDKKTAPCAQKIIEQGIRKVVVCSLDPNPRVNGKGIEMLSGANIEVETGILQEENEELNRFFYKYITQNKPYITVKIAQTLDGRISLEQGKQEWITGYHAKKIVHHWRSEYDAILVGAGTINIDNPLLTVRKVPGRNPYRIIIDGKLNVNIKNKIFNDDFPDKTIIFTSQNSDQKKIEYLRNKGCNVFELTSGGIKFYNFEHIFSELVKMNICSLLVEGGQQIFSQFISNKYADEIKLFIAPKMWGKGLFSISLEDKSRINNLQVCKIQRCGEDVLLTLRWKDK